MLAFAPAFALKLVGLDSVSPLHWRLPHRRVAGRRQRVIGCSYEAEAQGFLAELVTAEEAYDRRRTWAVVRARLSERLLPVLAPKLEVVVVDVAARGFDVKPVATKS